jgi:type IV pilus assembly protein PilO
MSLRDPKTQKVALTVVITVILLWGYFMTSILPFGYKPRAEKTKALQAEYEKASAELEKARRSVDNLPQLERESAELQKKWKQAEALLPSDKEVAELLTQVTRAGEQSGVKFELFRPRTPKPQEFYNENPVEVRVSAGYHQLGMFLSRVANLPRLVNVSDLNLVGKESSQNKKKAKAPSDHTLVASFTATAYSLRDVPAVDDAAPAEKAGRRGIPARAPRARRQTAGH